MSDPQDFAILARKLEDGCNIATSDIEAAQISMAISAKRQADALERLASAFAPCGHVLLWLEMLANAANAGRS